MRLRIIQQFGGRELTTAQLRDALPDVTQATLYRHVATLVEAEILTVVDERRIRGAVERTLALGERMAHVDQAELRTMDDAQLRTAFLTFLGEVGAGFDRFLTEADDSARDFLGFGQSPLFVSPEDLAAIQAGLIELLAPYRVDRTGARRVDLATILIPHPSLRSERPR
ncbi:helix-turn-helix domain-containing protein [Agromyces aerolatus]|uniref:helix-turn-helix domain-containing protein n=1 Tax=Agromyces sp. LY-1074 TaxID=3074080 RepID=UPI002860D03C|nr:helix-turn-helix domain-containing protein [Agromyces sp. LY-1074]